MDKDYKIFDRIDLAEKDWEVIEEIIEGIDSLESGIVFMSKRMKDRREALWKIIHELYPDLKGFDLMIKKENKQIVVLNTKKQ